MWRSSALWGRKSKPGHLLTLHTRIPAQCIQHLVGKMNDSKEIRRIANLGEQQESTKNTETKK